MKFMEDKKVWPICLDFTESNYLIRNSVFAHSVGYNSWRNLLVLSVIAIWISKQTFNTQIHKQTGHTNQENNDKRLCFFFNVELMYKEEELYFIGSNIFIKWKLEWGHTFRERSHNRIFFGSVLGLVFWASFGAHLSLVYCHLLWIFQKSTVGIEHWINTEYTQGEILSKNPWHLWYG